MTAKEFLMQGKRAEERINALIAERNRLRDIITGVRRSNPGAIMSSGGEHYDFTDYVAALDNVDNRLYREIIELCRIKEKISKIIDGIENITQRRVLELRYRNYLTWEEIAKEIPCNIRSAQRIHCQGLKNITIQRKSANTSGAVDTRKADTETDRE